MFRKLAIGVVVLGLAGLGAGEVSAEEARQGLERLAFMEGRWDMGTHAIVEGEWQEVRAEAIAIDRVLEGQFLRFAFDAEFRERQFTVEVTLSFDVARSIYRMTLNSTMMGYMDLYDGDFENGALRMSNEKTGTGFPVDRGLQLGRFDIRPASADAFSIEVMYSDDDGKMWQNYNRLHFKRVRP